MNRTEMNNQTRLKIIDAFFVAMNELGLNNLTVVDVIKRSGVSRGTFYHHFSDVPDLLEKVEKEFLDNMYNMLLPVEDKTQSPFQQFAISLPFLYKHRRKLQILSSGNGDTMFLIKLYSHLEYYVNQFADLEKFRELSSFRGLPTNFIVNAYVSVLMELVVFWLSKTNPESPDEFKDILLASESLSPNMLLDIIKHPEKY